MLRRSRRTIRTSGKKGRCPGRERPIDHWGIGAANWRPRAIPASTQVRMTLNGKPYTQPFEMWREVTMPGERRGAGGELRPAAADHHADERGRRQINRIEIMRMQVEDLRKAHGVRRRPR